MRNCGRRISGSSTPAIISPHYDIEFNHDPPQSFVLGDVKSRLTLPSAQSYSSYVLLPLLTFATRRKCLFVGGPGRGKTASAILMGVLSGASVRDVRRAMQHGHPQMTVADLLGNPLPADLVSAQRIEDIRISWRSWLGMRVKIIDEYNRIPTRTQSALLTVMGDNYAEILNHIYECPDSAWFLTANDEQGGGTYQVIEALRDRIDVIVQALAFNPRFLSELLVRIEQSVRPEEVVPRQIIFTEAEVDRLQERIHGVPLPPEVRRRLEFFASQFEFFEGAAEQFEYKTKTPRDSRASNGQVYRAGHRARSAEGPRLSDPQRAVGACVDDAARVRESARVFPWQSDRRAGRCASDPAVRLRDKLVPDTDAPFFDAPGNAKYRVDRVGWLRQLFDSRARNTIG
jgi:MoxR-like ATPase